MRKFVSRLSPVDAPRRERAEIGCGSESMVDGHDQSDIPAPSLTYAATDGMNCNISNHPTALFPPSSVGPCSRYDGGGRCNLVRVGVCKLLQPELTKEMHMHACSYHCVTLLSILSTVRNNDGLDVNLLSSGRHIRRG